MNLTLTREQAEFVLGNLRASCQRELATNKTTSTPLAEQFTAVADEIERQLKVNLREQFPCVNTNSEQIRAVFQLLTTPTPEQFDKLNEALGKRPGGRNHFTKTPPPPP